jgi:hypothetical protein
MKSKRLILTYIAVCLFLTLSNASLGLNPLKKVISSAVTKTTSIQIITIPRLSNVMSKRFTVRVFFKLAIAFERRF